MNMINKKNVSILMLVAQLCFATVATAKTFPIPAHGNVVGEVKTMVVQPNVSFAQIARDHDLGYTELREANPGVDPDHLIPGTVLVVPSQYILPDAPRQGIVVNLAEMRLYYYPPGGREVRTYPMGIGREGEETVIGVMSVVDKKEKPTWIPTEFMRKLRAAEGVILPKIVPPGPENPKGDYELRLSRRTYLIHGTNEPLGGVGQRSSSGCMRLYPEDIKPLFYAVQIGTPVYIIDEPYKAGHLDGRLYLESHVPLQESGNRTDDHGQIKRVINSALKGQPAMVDWDKALQISREEQGIPQEVGQVG